MSTIIPPPIGESDKEESNCKQTQCSSDQDKCPIFGATDQDGLGDRIAELVQAGHLEYCAARIARSEAENGLGECSCGGPHSSYQLVKDHWS